MSGKKVKDEKNAFEIVMSDRSKQLKKYIREKLFHKLQNILLFLFLIANFLVLLRSAILSSTKHYSSYIKENEKKT